MNAVVGTERSRSMWTNNRNVSQKNCLWKIILHRNNVGSIKPTLAETSTIGKC